VRLGEADTTCDASRVDHRMLLSWLRAEPPLNLRLEIEGVALGQSASGLRGGFTLAEAAVWYDEMSCTIDVKFSEALEPGRFVVDGTGRCEAPAATRPPSDSTVSLGPFRFRTRIR
jgi:hypothetical protein